MSPRHDDDQPTARRSAPCSRRRSSPSSRSCRWRSASAPTRRSSRSSTRCCSGRCRCPTPDRLVNLGAPGPKPGSTLVQQGRRLRRGLQLPDVPRPRAGADRPSPASPRTACSRANLAYAGRTTQRRGRARVGQLLPGARPPAGARPAAAAGRRRGDRRVARRRAVATPTGSATSTAGPTSLNQTLIVNGQAMTIVGVAPQGFDGHDARRRGRWSSCRSRCAG